ncbi:MAG: hypothetical protein R3B70_47805 [Polyangiaceae bacterium]
MKTLLVLCAAATWAVLGCDSGNSGEDGGAGGTGGGQGGSAGGEQGGAGGSTGGQGGMSTGGQGGTGGSTGGQGGASDAVPPTDKAALFKWLQDGNYKAYNAESAVHASAGPHGGGVRTFVNDQLEGSLSAGNAAHPMGAAAVKELYSGGTLTGWAASVKTDTDSAGGQGWYWYEIFSTTDGSNTVAAGNGVSLCFNCHSGGDDYVLSPYPLQ